MKEVLQLLTEKESELQRVRKQVDSLRAVIPLLANDRFEAEPNRKPVSNVQATGSDGLSSSPANSTSSFWSIAKRWRSK